MSKTAVIWLLIYIAGCGATLANPIYGLMTYMFAYYTNPPLHWWGDGLEGLRVSLFASILLAVSYFFHGAGRHSLGFFAQPQSKWLLALVAITSTTSPSAPRPK